MEFKYRYSVGVKLQILNNFCIVQNILQNCLKFVVQLKFLLNKNKSKYI